MAKKLRLEDQLTRLAAERAPKDRLAMLEQIVAYGETDLLCYRADASKLASRQQAHFDPVLAKLRQDFGIGCIVTQGVMPVAQSTKALKKLHDLFAEADDRELAALYVLTPLLGSALLTLALWKGLITVDEAVTMAHLDEALAAEQWGEDAQEKAGRVAKQKDIAAAAFFLDSQPTGNKAKKN